MSEGLAAGLEGDNKYTKASYYGRDVYVLPYWMTTADFARDITSKLGKYDADGAIYISHLDGLIENYQRWKECLPRVDLFYAVKANDDISVLMLLHQLGARFECASQREVETVLSLGGRPENIVIGNPTRTGPCLRYFASHGIDLLAVDSEEEMIKIKQLHPKARLLLRVLVPPGGGNDEGLPFGLKFGCHFEYGRQLLEKARVLGLNVVGIAFHLGSGVSNPMAHAFSVRQVAPLYDIAREMGFNMTILNIGGGFFGEDKSIHQIGEELNKALDTHFPATSEIRVIAEPGRFLATPVGHLYMNILDKRDKKALVGGYNSLSACRRLDQDQLCEGDIYVERLRRGDVPDMMYICNESIFQLFGLNQLRDARRFIEPLRTPSNNSRLLRTIIYGLSCYKGDILRYDADLPEMEVGDWLSVGNIGNYSLTLRSAFNRLPECVEYVTISDKYAGHLTCQNI